MQNWFKKRSKKYVCSIKGGLCPNYLQDSLIVLTLTRSSSLRASLV